MRINIIVVVFFIFSVILQWGMAMGQEGEAFILIQGDKKMPFYVKYKNKMQPRYSKDYCILTKLPGGNSEIEILFQQNRYPPEIFTINMPPNGSRAFLLDKRDSIYVLYDVRTKEYIQPVKK